MKINAVTVCVDYGDFLAETLRHNLPHLAKLVVVTSTKDHQTQHVCNVHGVQCLVSDDHLRNGSDFAKGRMVERALHHLPADGWRLHLDADVVLPTNTLRMLEAAHLREESIYGVDRIMVKSWEEWQTLQASGYLHSQHAWHCLIDFPDKFRVGARWGTASAGWCPIGFFQLWHASAEYRHGTRHRPYPHEHNDACRTDVQHSLQWDRRDREMIPEIIAIHLESEPSKNGANWKGRTTKRFGPAAKTSIGFHSPSTEACS